MNTYVITDTHGIVVEILINHTKASALKNCAMTHEPRWLIHTSHTADIKLRRPMPHLHGEVQFVAATPRPDAGFSDEHRALVAAAHARLMSAEAAERSYDYEEARQAREAYHAALAAALDAANATATTHQN